MTWWIGKYEILGELGRGGMSKVYLANQHGPHNFKRRVVLKTLLDDQKDSQRMINEAKALSEMNHPNVISIIEFINHENRFFLVTEYIHGVSFAKLRKEAGRLPTDITLGATCQILRGLSYVHNFRDKSHRPMGFVHRDVSAGNIMVQMDGVTKLIDFGVVKGFSITSGTSIGKIVGKVKYLAPDVLKGVSSDPRSDLYALGVILYESLTYRRLHPSQVEAEVFKRLSTGVFFEELKLEKIPPKLGNIIKKTLHPTIDERYRRAEDMLEDLKAFRRQQGMLDDDEVTQWLQQKIQSIEIIKPPSDTMESVVSKSGLSIKNGKKAPILVALLILLVSFLSYKLYPSFLGIEKSFVIITQPPGATILVEEDDTKQYRTPATVKLLYKTGSKYHLKISHPHFRTERFTLLEKNPQKSFKIKLSRKNASLFFKGFPKKSILWINGEKYGKLPTLLENIKVGKEYELKISIPRKNSQVIRTVYLDRDKDLIIHYKKR